MKIFKVMSTACAALVLTAAFAIAQTTPAPAPDNVVDFGPVLNTILTGVSGLVLAGLSWGFAVAVKWVQSKTKLAKAIDLESAQRRFNEAAKRSMSYATNKAKEIVGDGKVKIDSAWVRTAAEYMLEFWPELVEGMDLDQIGKTIVARLDNGAMSQAADAVAANNSPAATPVVPGVTVPAVPVKK